MDGRSIGVSGKRCTIFQGALALRHRRNQGEISEAGLAVARGRLEARLDRALGRRYRSATNERLANHLDREREAIFPFLSCPGLKAQWACRAGAVPGDGSAQGLGRQPHRAGSLDAADLGQPARYLPATKSPCSSCSHRLALLCFPELRPLDLTAADLPPLAPCWPPVSKSNGLCRPCTPYCRKALNKYDKS
jgi:hypothetical protein